MCRIGSHLAKSSASLLFRNEIFRSTFAQTLKLSKFVNVDSKVMILEFMNKELEKKNQVKRRIK